MQSITHVVERSVAPDDRIVYKLKIYTVPVARNAVGNDSHAVALPAMNAITALLFLFAMRSQHIVFDSTVNTMLCVDTEEGIIQNVIPYNHIPAIVNFYACKIFDT